MLMYLLKQAHTFVFGVKAFHAYEQGKKEFHYNSGRIDINLSSQRYRRWDGLLRGFRYRNGLLQIKMRFNPGLPDEIFAFLNSIGGDVIDSIKRVVVVDSVEAMNELFDEEGSFDSATDTGIKWQVETPVRSTADLRIIFDWFDAIKLVLNSEQGDDYGGELSYEESRLVNNCLSQIIERESTWQLNS